MIYEALPKGINITIFNWHFSIAYYAIIILAGAILAYYLSKYFAKKEGLDASLLEGVFYIAFPLGIVGARIWYVIAQWGKEFSFQDFAQVFKIWEGGLAIQGGAILGIISGVYYLHHRKPHLNVLHMADCVVPNILVAQAIGRWGNFFNQEVYGKITDGKNWAFLGDWFVNQMTITDKYGVTGFRTPLFLIEGILNLLGYFLMMFVIRKFFKKYLKPGYFISFYLIWYGVVRAILEPLRDKEFQMGIMASEVMAIIFVIVGIALLFVFYQIDKKMKLREKEINNNYQKYIEETKYEA